MALLSVVSKFLMVPAQWVCGVFIPGDRGAAPTTSAGTKGATMMFGNVVDRAGHLVC